MHANGTQLSFNFVHFTTTTRLVPIIEKRSAQRTMSTMMTSPSYYSKLGDLGQLIGIGLSLVYAVCVVAFAKPGLGFFDEEWVERGFCVSNADVPYWSSFDACLYVDTAFAVLLGALYLSWRNLPGMELPNRLIAFNILGALGHGLVHGLQAMKLRAPVTEESSDVETQATDPWFLLVFATMFWLPLIKGSMPKEMKMSTIAFLSAGVTYAQTFVEEKYGFAYVQTMLAIFFGIGLMLLPAKEKGLQYVLWSFMVGIPTVLVGFAEALGCSAFYKAWGGHVLYDLTIVVMLTTYYITCTILTSRMMKKKA